MRKKNEDTKIRIYEYINEYIKNNRVSPTINEIAKNAGCAVSTAYKFLERLKDEGLIDMAGRGRITSSVNNWEMGYAPILGMVACGKPKLAVEDIQGYLPLNMDYFGKGEYFLLVASGESMVNADIKDGDLVLIRKQNTFENGQIAVVLTESDCSDESMATLKRVYRDDENKRFRLHPENDNMKDFLRRAYRRNRYSRKGNQRRDITADFSLFRLLYIITNARFSPEDFVFRGIMPWLTLV